MTTMTTITTDDRSPASTSHDRLFAQAGHQVLDEHDRSLWEALRLQVGGGKRFRPALLNGLYSALGGQDLDCAARVADAIELLHTSFVIHDDVIDDDQMRRGQPNISGIFSARASDAGVPPARARLYGDAAAILAGDLALAAAVREMALCGARPDRVVALMDLLEDVLHRSAAGELADVRISLTGDASLAEVLDVAEWKTAAYSFELPLQAAGILADVPDDIVSTLGSVGRHLGTAFQLCDDLSGVFGSVEQTGKDPLGDLREGKCTALIAIARTHELWPDLAPFVGDPELTTAGAQQARELIIRCGARQAVETLIQDVCSAAVNQASSLLGPAHRFLLDTIDWLVPLREGATPATQSADSFRMQGAA